jgi:hypothetical protein
MVGWMVGAALLAAGLVRGQDMLLLAGAGGPGAACGQVTLRPLQRLTRE